jgi:hypothetical protein
MSLGTISIVLEIGIAALLSISAVIASPALSSPKKARVWA